MKLKFNKYSEEVQRHKASQAEKEINRENFINSIIIEGNELKINRNFLYKYDKYDNDDSYNNRCDVFIKSLANFIENDKSIETLNLSGLSLAKPENFNLIVEAIGKSKSESLAYINVDCVAGPTNRSTSFGLADCEAAKIVEALSKREIKKENLIVLDLGISAIGHENGWNLKPVNLLKIIKKKPDNIKIIMGCPDSPYSWVDNFIKKDVKDKIMSKCDNQAFYKLVDKVYVKEISKDRMQNKFFLMGEAFKNACGNPMWNVCGVIFSNLMKMNRAEGKYTIPSYVMAIQQERAAKEKAQILPSASR